MSSPPTFHSFNTDTRLYSRSWLAMDLFWEEVKWIMTDSVLTRKIKISQNLLVQRKTALMDYNSFIGISRVLRLGIRRSSEKTHQPLLSSRPLSVASISSTLHPLFARLVSQALYVQVGPV